MYTIAYKWRLSTTRYAYITSTQYRVDGSEPDYTLAQIPATGKLDDATEQIIKDIVRNMTADEYRQCFENMLEKIANDKDGQYIKLKNWEYYYHFNTNENGDEKVFFVDATASATISNDGEVHAEVVNDKGTLKFTFQIPQGVNGRDGIDGKDGAPGVPINDGKYIESIYKLTTTNNIPQIKLDDDWDIEGSEYQTNDYKPNGWTDRPSGITSIYKYEWVSTRKYDLVKKLWDEFSEPAIMSRWGEDGKDGDGIEYVYKKTKDETKPLPPSTPDDWEDENSLYQKNDEYAGFIIDEGWTDVPSKLEKDTYKFEWVSVRKQKNGIWQPFSEPALWSNWGKDGDDVEYIYFLNNDNEVPLFDDYTNSDGYQSENFLPTTNGEEWTDNYQSPTYEKRFSWISSRRKRDGKWLDFTGTTLFNVYKIGGKAYVDLYTRSNTRIDSQNLPSYENYIYYSFKSDRFYSDNNLTSEITAVNGLNNTVWYTDMPADNTAKMLFKTSALIEIKDNYDEVVAIPKNLWYGPYLLSSNGENAISIAPYVVLDDDSLSIPIKQDTKTPHEAYEYSFNANLYYGDNIANINECIITTSNDNKIINVSSEKNENNRKVNIKFNINNSFEFSAIELVYITLKGEYEGKTIEALGQFKIIPFISEDAILYKILLNQDAIFVPGEPCTNENGDGIWKTTLEVKVVDNKGNEINVPNTDDNRIVYESKNGKLESIPGSGLTLIGCTEKTDSNQKVISELPNPLKIIYQVNGKTREIEYVNFTNMPLNGISSRLVFAYCSLDEGETPNTPSGGTINFDTNEIYDYPKGTYIDSEGVEQEEIEWGGINNFNGVVWLSQCQFFNVVTQDLTWTTPVRISGAKGDNPYHVELSNDMDQIYVTDDVIIYPQTLTTTISLFNGDEKALLNKDYISVSNNNIFETVTIDNIDETDVIVKLTTKTGVTITGKTIDVNLNISGEPYGKTYNFVKTFKLKVLHGTKDYDLDVSPTFIKKNKNKQYSESAITVNITERDIATDSKVITRLTSFTDGLSITYFYNNDNDNQKKLTTLGDKIPVANVEGYNDEINKITINLYKQEEPIDQVFVECVSDGFDGSSYHLELTNEYEQLYVTDNVVVVSGLVETNYSLFNGTADANDDISKFSINIGDRKCEIENYSKDITGITSDSITINPIDKKVSIVFNTGQIINERDIKAKFSIETKNGVLIEKILKIIVLNGIKDYDLVVQPTYLKLDKYNNLANSSITVSVSERDITTTNSTIKLLESLPDNIKVKYSIKNYGEQLSSVDLDYTGKTNEINVTNNIEYAIIKLSSGDTILDYVKIETLKDGTDGIDGLSQIVDLSNDYDQLYVTDGVVVENQTIDTTVYLTNGLEKFNINTGDTRIYLENKDITDNIPKDKDGKGVKLTFNFNSGVAFEKNELVYTIEVNYNNNTFKKTFKIIILNGTKDYDLDINPTIVRKDKHGNYTPSSLTLNVIESNISTTNRNSIKIGTLPSGYTLQYFVDNVQSGAPYDLSIDSEFNFEVLKPNSYIRFELNSGDTPVDYAIVECVSDGVDGSAYHLELSNEFDQVYTINKKILPGQTGITTTVQLFNGTQSASISDLAVTNFDGISTTGISGNTVSISFDEGAETEEKEYVYKISGKTPEGDDVEKDFKIIVLNGNKDYDLHSTHTYVKKYGDNIIDTSITITVSESIIGTNDRSETTLNSLPEGMEIKVFVDGNEQDEIRYNSGITLNLENFNLQQQIEVKLSFEGKSIDYIVIEVVKDGKDGKDGVSPYHIELSNDFDQILTTDNIVVYDQTIETTLSVICGINTITANSKDIRCECEDSSLFTVSSASTEDNKHFTFTINPNIGATLEQNKTYDFNFIVNTGATNLNYEISKKFKVIALNGTVDYDLSVTPTFLKKNVSDYSNSAITITVKETDISRTDRQINILNKLPDQLSIECYINEKEYNNTYSSGITIGSQDFPDNGNIYVKLLKSGYTIDEVTVEIISDGKDGDPGEDGTNIEFIYKLYENETDYNNDIVNFTEYSALTKDVILENLTGWTDSPCGITKEYQIEACSQHIKEAGATGFTSWCTPFIWAKWGDDGIDGDGVEYIFQITNRGVTPTNPGGEIEDILSGCTGSTLSALTEIVNTFDFFPGDKWITTNEELISNIADNYNLNKDDFKSIVGSLDKNWTDDPMDVGPYEPLEWVSIRRKKVKLDGTFEYIYTDPTIWAEWKRDTYDSLTEFMFTIYDSRVDLSGVKISGGTWENIKNGNVYDVVETLSSITENDVINLSGITWYDSVPNHNMYTQSVWMVKGFASGEIIYTGGTIEANGEEIPTGITYSNINWTSPTKLIDNQHIQVEYGFEVKDGTGQSVVPKPINLQVIVSGLGLNYNYITLEEEFRNQEKASDYDFGWTDNPTGESPTWMITSTFYNGVWSDWVVSKIKGEKGERGETGQGVQIKGSFKTEEELKYAYYYYMQDKSEASDGLKKEINNFKNANVDKVDDDGNLFEPSKYFLNGELILGDSYIVDECTINEKNVNGYLFVYVFANDTYTESWEPVGQVKGDSSYIYIVYASSVTINGDSSKTYQLTEGGTYSDGKTKYYGTTPGKYIGIHAATQQYEGHPYPEELYGNSARTNDSKFIWSKWEGDDGFGQEQIFILSGETAPAVPKYDETKDENGNKYSEDTWNTSDFVPYRWNDKPLTPTLNNRCCWMAVRKYPFNGEGINNFSGETDGTAILFSRYSIDGNNGSSPFHLELSNEMEQVYTINNTIIAPQTASTIITLFEGTSGITLNKNNVGLPKGVGATTNNDGSLTIYKTYKTGDTFENDEEQIKIRISADTINGLDYDIVRTFKVIKLNGTKDYDLDVTPTFIKKDENGNLSHSSITISINESEISSTNREIKQTTGVPSGYMLSFSIDDGKYDELKYDGTSTAIIITGVNNYCIINLTKDSRIVDNVTVEILKDGKDGADGKSPFHIELSNEFDLISVVNGRVNGKQDYTTSFELWEGDVDRTSTITSITIGNIDNNLISETGLTAFKLTFEEGYMLNKTIYGVLKVKTTNNKLHHRTFTIKPIEGVALYQLESDVGFVVEGKPTDIAVSVKQKTNDGLIDVDSLPSGMHIYVYYDNATDAITSTTATALTYSYTGDTNISEIDFRLKRGNVVYDNINIEVKNNIKPSGTLNINPLNQIVYVEKIEGKENKYKPLVSSVTFDASFVYEGSEKPLTGVSISVTGSSSDFSATPVISDYGIEVKYLDYLNLTTDNLTKERYVFETKYGSDTYYNNFFITYVEPQLDVWVDGDCIYIPDDYKGDLSKEFIFEAKFENSNVTHDCEIEVVGYTGITFNLRSNGWYMNIPSGVASVDEITGFTINFTYNGISTSKEVAIIRRGKNSENWYINVFPKYLSIDVSEPINLYITKNNYNGEYISLENALTQNMKLYYIINGECVNFDENGNEITVGEICYSDYLEYAPKEHGNNVFYPNGCLITSITTSITEGNVVEEITITGYTQEPIYSSIEFKLYYEPNESHKELVASEIVERYDILKNSEIKKINAHGLIINATDIFEEYNNNDYDIVIKAVK